MWASGMEKPLYYIYLFFFNWKMWVIIKWTENDSFKSAKVEVLLQWHLKKHHYLKFIVQWRLKKRHYLKTSLFLPLKRQDNASVINTHFWEEIMALYISVKKKSVINYIFCSSAIFSSIPISSSLLKKNIFKISLKLISILSLKLIEIY